MTEMWEQYPDLTRVVLEAHECRKMASGHDFDHDFAVAQLAREFRASMPHGIDCFDDHLAWAAGICHSADRLIAADRGTPRGEIPQSDVETLVSRWLNAETFTDEEEKIVIRAVLHHGRFNDPDDDGVTIALKDADRVVNARLDVVIRSGQFQHDLPVLDPALLLDDTRGKYNSRLTVVADLLDCLEWGNLEDERFCVRTRLAREMISARVTALRQFLEAIIEQRREEGLVPYPPEMVISHEEQLESS